MNLSVSDISLMILFDEGCHQASSHRQNESKQGRIPRSKSHSHLIGRSLFLLPAADSHFLFFDSRADFLVKSEQILDPSKGRIAQSSESDCCILETVKNPPALFGATSRHAYVIQKDEKEGKQLDIGNDTITSSRATINGKKQCTHTAARSSFDFRKH